jgi:hypothetical protein
MMLDNQNAMRKVQKLPFCYLCGKRLVDPRNDDHVPPDAIFRSADRNFPLTLPTHEKCNGDRSAEDQVIGQLVGLLHRKSLDPRQNKLTVQSGRFPDGTTGAALYDIDLKAIIRRWVRGFHSALYGEFLPDDSGLFMTSLPLPEGEPTGVGGRFNQIPAVIPEFVKELKRNRATNTLDRILCRNKKCRYECVWTQADRGQWLCMYGLDLYGWIELGDTTHFEARGCVGAYRRPAGGTPPGATCATRLEFPVDNVERLNPFGR